MTVRERWNEFKKLFRNPYRIVVFNDHNLHILKQIRFNARTLVLGLVGAVVVIIIGVTMLIAFTPLREYIPGYPSGKLRQTLVTSALRADSLEQRMALYDRYFQDFRAMLMGENPIDTVQRRDTIRRPNLNELKGMDPDSLFRDQLSQEQFNFRDGNDNGSSRRGGVSGLIFFPPVKGVVTSKQDLANDHIGVDVVAQSGAKISTVLDGTVVMAEWTLETGYVISVQHDQNLLSYYKHNSELLKRPGDKVKAGEVIAIIGNTGRESTGPHLHFELWMNGTPLNPLDYVSF